MIYCNAFGFIPAFAKLVQNVWRRVWGVVTFGKASSWLLEIKQNTISFSIKRHTPAPTELQAAHSKPALISELLQRSIFSPHDVPQ